MRGSKKRGVKECVRRWKDKGKEEKVEKRND